MLSCRRDGCGSRFRVVSGVLPCGQSAILHFPPPESSRQGLLQLCRQEGALGRSASPARMTREGERKKPDTQIKSRLFVPPKERRVLATSPHTLRLPDN